MLYINTHVCFLNSCIQTSITLTTMASHFLEIFGFSLLVFASCVKGVPEDDVSFDQNYFSLWGLNHITRVDNSKEVQLLLDQYSGGSTKYMHVCATLNIIRYFSAWLNLLLHGRGWIQINF